MRSVLGPAAGVTPRRVHPGAPGRDELGSNFLDEPTGALDTRTARQVLQMLRQAVKRTGQTTVMVTHDPVAASFADSVVFLADGRLAGSMTAPSPAQIAERMTNLGEW